MIWKVPPKSGVPARSIIIAVIAAGRERGREEWMIKHLEALLEVALLLDIAHLAISSSSTLYNFQQIPFRTIASTSPYKSGRNCEVSTPAERRADQSQALTIVNRSTIEKVQRNHR